MAAVRYIECPRCRKKAGRTYLDAGILVVCHNCKFKHFQKKLFK